LTDIILFLKSFENNDGKKIGFPTKIRYNLSQKFGENPSIYKKWGYKGHFGIDILAPHGTPVLACDAGKVTRAGYTAGNGNFIEIEHDWGKSLYLHFKNEPINKLGAKIKKGEEIGKVGNTGYVIPAPTPKNPLAGTHLHFSIKRNDTPNPDYKDYIDPIKFFEPVQ
jgi:murein DD-endopeptidase MepM/ murein hydrolase activator NlpD